MASQSATVASGNSPFATAARSPDGARLLIDVTGVLVVWGAALWLIPLVLVPV